jgi:hypothetical protein
VHPAHVGLVPIPHEGDSEEEQAQPNTTLTLKLLSLTSPIILMDWIYITLFQKLKALYIES